MMVLTERDKLVIGALIDRGWASTRYLKRFFPTHQAMLSRLNILKRYGLLQSVPSRELMKHINFKTTTVDYSKFFNKNSVFYRLSDDFYKDFKLPTAVLKNPRMITHQIYQEYIELFFLENFNIKEIKSNPDLNPRPDLYFNYNNKNISIEIERTLKRNQNARIEKIKKTDGSFRERRRPGFSYSDHIDRLLNSTDLIIYYFETEQELKKFLKNSYSKRLYCSTFDNPDELINSMGARVLTRDVLNAP